MLDVNVLSELAGPLAVAELPRRVAWRSVGMSENADFLVPDLEVSSGATDIAKSCVSGLKGCHGRRYRDTWGPVSIWGRPPPAVLP